MARLHDLELNAVEYGMLAGLKKNNDKLLGPIEGKVFLVQLNNRKLIKKTLVSKLSC
jgi:hypothetical protein